MKGPSVKDPDPELSEILTKAASLANLTKEQITKAILSYFAAAVVALTDDEVRRKFAKYAESPEFPRRLTEVMARATGEAMLDLTKEMEKTIKEAEKGENPITKRVAEELRERLGDTTKPINEDMSDVAKKVYNALKRIKEGTVREISEETNLSLPDVINAINELKRSGLIEEDGEIIRVKNG